MNVAEEDLKQPMVDDEMKMDGATCIVCLP